MVYEVVYFLIKCVRQSKIIPVDSLSEQCTKIDESPTFLWSRQEIKHESKRQRERTREREWKEGEIESKKEGET